MSYTDLVKIKGYVELALQELEKNIPCFDNATAYTAWRMEKERLHVELLNIEQKIKLEGVR